jgi:protein-S-isoprenylcysteine O-methyltransferase Ste14
MKPQTRRKIVLWCVQSALGLVGYAVVIFLAAGSIRWVWGWVLIGVSAAALVGHVVVLVPINPDLLAERQEGFRPEGTKRWDRWLTMSAASLGTVVMWVIAGLEVRFRWTAGMALPAHISGVAVTVLGYALFLWAMASNAFFAEGVRIQTDRGHTVAAGGPYRFVRHPGYAGAILAEAATPLLLGSPWALIPAAGSVICYVIRTLLEDRTVMMELEGYETFACSTRYRLVPGLW